MHRLKSSKAPGVLVPRPTVKPVSSALDGRFLTTGPPGSPWIDTLLPPLYRGENKAEIGWLTCLQSLSNRCPNKKHTKQSGPGSWQQDHFQMKFYLEAKYMTDKGKPGAAEPSPPNTLRSICLSQCCPGNPRGVSEAAWKTTRRGAYATDSQRLAASGWKASWRRWAF